jgi:hypothetical protein
MKPPEKNTERFLQTITRTIFTTTIIAFILTFAHVFPVVGMSKLFLFAAIWLMIFCIVFGGHWLELMFINYIKLLLPQNRILLYFARIIYWFLSAIPLFMLATWVGSLLINQGLRLGNWWAFGFFYIGIELLMHAIMHLRGKKSFYNAVY